MLCTTVLEGKYMMLSHWMRQRVSHGNHNINTALKAIWRVQHWKASEV